MASFRTSFNYILNSQFFESGPIPTPTKLRNPTIVGSGDPDSTQLSNPSRFHHWLPSFGDNDHCLDFKFFALFDSK